MGDPHGYQQLYNALVGFERELFSLGMMSSATLVHRAVMFYEGGSPTKFMGEARLALQAVLATRKSLPAELVSAIHAVLREIDEGFRTIERGQRELAKGVEQEIAITEQLADSGLSMESEPWARYASAGGSLRMISLLIRRRKKKRRGEWVAPLPWAGVLIGAGIVASAVAVVTLFIWLAAR
jgi:hypothetical protein